MGEKLTTTLRVAAVAVGLPLYIGAGIGTAQLTPNYTAVYLDDNAKTYIALPCFAEWQQRPSDKVALLRLAKASDAWQLRYEGDKTCREAGGFTADGNSMTGLLLVRPGIITPPVYWWDMPYRTEHGVVYPKNGLRSTTGTVPGRYKGCFLRPTPHTNYS